MVRKAVPAPTAVTFEKDVKEGEAGVCGCLGKDIPGRQERPVQRPRGRSLSDVFEEQQGGQVAARETSEGRVMGEEVSVV